MVFNNHNLPHFHVVYVNFKVVINIQDEIANGFLPKRALKLVFDCPLFVPIIIFVTDYHGLS